MKMTCYKYLRAATLQFFFSPLPNGPLHMEKPSRKTSSTNFSVHAYAIEPPSAFIMAIGNFLFSDDKNQKYFLKYMIYIKRVNYLKGKFAI